MRWIVHTIETWVHVEASPQLTLTPTLHWRIWDALRPGALHSSSSCSLFRLASIRSSSSSPPSPRIPRLLSRWSFQPPLKSTGSTSPPAFTSATYKRGINCSGLSSRARPVTLYPRSSRSFAQSRKKKKEKKKDWEDVRSRQTELEAEGRHYSPFPLSEEMSFKSESMECYANSIVTKCEAAPELDHRRSIARGCGEWGEAKVLVIFLRQPFSQTRRRRRAACRSRHESTGGRGADERHWDVSQRRVV